MSVYLFICLFACLLPMNGLTAEPIKTKTKLGKGLTLTQGVFQSRSMSRSFGAIWRMLIKLLTEAARADLREARKGRENSSAKSDKSD